MILEERGKKTVGRLLDNVSLQFEPSEIARQLSQDLFIKKRLKDQSSFGSKLKNVIQQSARKNGSSKVFEINEEFTPETTISSDFCMFYRQNWQKIAEYFTSNSELKLSEEASRIRKKSHER